MSRSPSAWIPSTVSEGATPLIISKPLHASAEEAMLAAAAWTPSLMNQPQSKAVERANMYGSGSGSIGDGRRFAANGVGGEDSSRGGSRGGSSGGSRRVADRPRRTSPAGLFRVRST